MWGNAFFIAKIRQCRGDAVVIPSHGREMGQALFRSFVFVLKKRFRSGGSTGDPPTRSPHPLDTDCFLGKKFKIATQLATEFSQRQFPRSARDAACRTRGAARVAGCIAP